MYSCTVLVHDQEVLPKFGQQRDRCNTGTVHVLVHVRVRIDPVYSIRGPKTLY